MVLLGSKSYLYLSLFHIPIRQKLGKYKNLPFLLSSKRVGNVFLALGDIITNQQNQRTLFHLMTKNYIIILRNLIVIFNLQCLSLTQC